MTTSHEAPLVSVIMANRNGAAHIGAAVKSVLRQSLLSLELIVSDDGSTDESAACARAAAQGDPRLTILQHTDPQHTGPSGPGAARNRAVERARGAWIAIVDSDDFIHPNRLEHLIGAAERDGADIAADDLLVFYEHGARAPHAHLKGALARRPSWISAAHYVETNALNGSAPSLGYLKPIIRRARLPAGAAYDESLPIAEDYDLIARLLCAGARMRVYPELTYFYRKHAASISHRLSAEAVRRMQSAHARMRAQAGADRTLGAALDKRGRSLEKARAFAELVEALKARRIGAAIGALARRPSAALMLSRPLFDRLARRTAQPAAPAAEPAPRIALLSRQRIVGATNGSSVYVLSLARALKAAGHKVDFIGASRKIFGRWPMMRLRPEIDAFDSYIVPDSIRLGRLLAASDVRQILHGALAVLQAGLAKLGLSANLISRAAPHAVAIAAERADQLFVARRTRHPVAAVLCDYAFLTPLAPYTLSPDAPTLVIMHDLISSRTRDPGAELGPRSFAELTADQEFALLSLADAAIAIQADEAAQTRARLHGRTTLLAPLAVEPAPGPQAGRSDVLLFVGSNTAPNLSGLRWFLAFCWPRIRQARPDARLYVAGSVGRALTITPKGVHLLDVVDSLDDLYRDAGVVISPLRAGSGLKVKLLEAMAAGKAVIGTTVSAQGVEALVRDAMIIEDDAVAFAAAAIACLGDATRRVALGAAALRVVGRHFSAEECYAPLIAFIREGDPSAPRAWTEGASVARK